MCDMWNRQAIPGEPVEDLAKQRIGLGVEVNHTVEQVVFTDSKHNQWEVPLPDTASYAVRDDPRPTKTT